MIKKVLRSLLLTVTSGERLNIILAALAGTVVGNIVATALDGHPDAGPYLAGLVTGLGIALLATVITLEMTEKRSKRRK